MEFFALNFLLFGSAPADGHTSTLRLGIRRTEMQLHQLGSATAGAEILAFRLLGLIGVPSFAVLIEAPLLTL